MKRTSLAFGFILATIFGLSLVASAAVPTGYVSVAAENATYTLPSDGTVDYCTPTVCSPAKHYTKGTAVTCNNATFVDPLYGIVKQCYFLADPVPPAFMSGNVPILYVPQSTVQLSPPINAAQLLWQAADAPQCIGPIVGKQYYDSANKAQVWAASCNQKGFSFNWQIVMPSVNGQPSPANVAIPTSFPKFP